MSKAEMVAKLADAASIQKKQAEKVVTELVGMIKGFLLKGERIALAGLGTFSTAARKARTGRNPRTGAAVKIPARKAVKFSAAAPVRKELNAPAGAKKAAAKAKPAKKAAPKAAKKAPAKAAKKKK
jgi:DNA-binding protein HU-beta